MPAVPGPHLLYTNRVNTSWHLYPVYKQMFLSGPVTHVASAGLLASAESRQVSWRARRTDGGGIVLFPWVAPLFEQFVRKSFSSSSHCKT